MTSTSTRLRLTVAPLVLGLIGMMAACAPTPAAPTGISFNPPKVGYIGKTLDLKATAANKLPVQFSLDAASTACSLSGNTVSYNSVGECIVLADQPGDANTEGHPQVSRTINVYECPPLISGTWTGPQGTSAEINFYGTTFLGSADLSAFGLGTQTVGGTVECEVASMTFNGVALTGRLNHTGQTLSSSYQGISIVLNAPAAQN